MALHPNAWRNQNIVVLDENSFLSMQIEQALAAAAPSNEIIFESFSNYSEAYDFCREKGNVGLVFVSPRVGVPLVDLLDQLGRFYQYYGSTIRGVIVMDEKDSEIETYRARLNQHRYIFSISRSDIINKSKTADILQEIWLSYRESIEREHFPTTLQDTFLAFTQDQLETESRIFTERATNLLSSSLNLSWLDLIALKWAPVLNLAAQKDRLILQGSDFIKNLAQIAIWPSNLNALDAAKDKNVPLSQRLGLMVSELDRQRSAGRLALFLSNLAKLSKPGSPALYRYVTKDADQILKFAGVGASMSTDQSSLRKVG